MDYIFYSDPSSITGRALKEALGINGGTQGPGERPARLIRWGSRAESRFNAAGGALNKKGALNDASNKGRSLELLTAAGVNVPPAADRFTGDLLVGRTENHVGGNGFFLITSQRDFELASRNLHCSHFMAYIPTQREYRIHVFRGQVIGAAEKLMGENATSLHIRNVSTGWKFRYNNIDRIPRETERVACDAVRALGLDFGAVDIIKSINDNLYVLEVNTAPSLVQRAEGGGRRDVDEGPVFDAYVAAFRQWLAEAPRNGNTR